MGEVLGAKLGGSSGELPLLSPLCDFSRSMICISSFRRSAQETFDPKSSITLSASANASFLSPARSAMFTHVVKMYTRIANMSDILERLGIILINKILAA